MNPNPDETSPASGRQQSKSLEEILRKAENDIEFVVARFHRTPLAESNEDVHTEVQNIILRALQAATAESEDTARLNWLEHQGHDYGSDKGWSSISAVRTWTVHKSGHGGDLREAIDAARQQERSQR